MKRKEEQEEEREVEGRRRRGAYAKHETFIQNLLRMRNDFNRVKMNAENSHGMKCKRRKRTFT